ncbi:hypothetical protein [Flagellimonas sp.]|uniref:hypothetical protein n=1 Tax=Flagellimonas sp. TaxID=2058762 RepID=UPI003BA8612F
MGKLIIEGDRKYLDVIVRENRTRASKYGLKMFFEEPKQKPEKVEQKPVKQQAKSGSGKTTGKK